MVLGVFAGLVIGLGAAAVWARAGGVGAGRALVWLMTPEYKAEPVPPNADPKIKQDIAIELTTIATGVTQPTDIRFPPGVADQALVLEKTGMGRWLKIKEGTHGKLFSIDVLTASETGLLGAAFHPDYAKNGRVFLHYIVAASGKDMNRIEEWRFDPPGDLVHASAKAVRVVLEVEQPYQNHDGGCLAFGPDGYLYIGYGDGGFRNDPNGHGQDGKTWLGSMLRVDVNVPADAKPAYRVPPDNPFVGRNGFAPETFAYGLRNPWRYSFDPKGRLIVADVGQDRFEELDIVQAGDNLGWNVREAFACLDTNAKECPLPGAVDPIHAYDRALGNSITGGYVYLGKRLPALQNKYVFADFTSGRIFALDLPDDRTLKVDSALSLGKFPVFISTFGRDHAGELYIGSFADGRIMRIDPAKPKSAAKKN